MYVSKLPVSQSRLDDALLIQSQHRNTAARAFGGFLMRRAFELSFATAFMFAGARPAFVRCDSISFEKPVEIGSLLKFSSRILASFPEPCPAQPRHGEIPWLIAAETLADVIHPTTREITRTNAFKYVFRCWLPEGERTRVVVPTSEEDAKRMASMLEELEEAELESLSKVVEGS